MKEKVLFTEEQKFKQWWLWMLLLGLNGLFNFKIAKQLYYKNLYAPESQIDSGVFIGFTIIFLLTILFYFFKLQTLVKVDGIYVRFFPIQMAHKKYTWDVLKKIYIRKYNPIGEYGGWGFRFGLYSSENALNVSGNQGLQLEIFNKNNLLIGTNKPQQLKDLLIKLNKYKD